MESSILDQHSKIGIKFEAELSSDIMAAVAMVSLTAILQAPVQALLRPSMWVPCFRELHMCVEIWKVDVPMSEFISALLRAVELVKRLEDNTEFLDFHKVKEDGSFVRILAFTRAEWLDVVEITHVDGQYEVCSFSSGFLPLILPFACLCNLICFLTPFVDFGVNRRRLDRLRNAMDITIHVADT